MKKSLSIRLKMTIWFSVILIALVAVTFVTVMLASRLVLRGTIRNYLIGMVEENVDKIKYVDAKEDSIANEYISFGDGYLEIDMDFLDVVNDVHAGLYSSDGNIIYGENPIPQETRDKEFKGSYTWYIETEDIRYDIYDRKLNLNAGDQELWIRGIVPETNSVEQLREITRIVLFILPLLIIISVISAYFLMRRMLLPIRNIENTAEKISKGDDLKARIDTSGSKDEIGRLAGVFNHMLDRLERSFETEKQFTSDASHELRTPTTVIYTQSEYILEKERTVEEYKDAMQVIKNQAVRMSGLIDDMLSYTRVDQSMDRYPFEKTDLANIAKNLADQIPSIDDKNMTVETEIVPESYINGNEMLVTRLLQNLIDNAIRYGKVNGHINISVMQQDEKIVLSVKDDGVGIPEQDIDKIFDRFYRGDRSRTEKGTGLGLSIVKKIVEVHDAEIKVESTVGQGTEFIIIFSKYFSH